MTHYRDLLSQCEEHVRAGEAHRAAELLNALNLSKIPREYRLPFANVCRRANLLTLGLKLLTPIVRGDESANDAETAEYAVLLQRTGSVHEALKLLQNIRSTNLAEPHLYTAFCHFNRWEYKEAIEPLNRYLGCELTPYARLVGQVNLLAALIFVESFIEAEALAIKNIALAHELNATRLEGNCHELYAQIHFQREAWDLCEEELTKAEALFGDEQTFDRLYVEKWRAIASALKTGKTKCLEKVREKALELGDSETIRDVDLYSQKVRFNEDAFNKLYFGTPHQTYRERIERELKRKPSALTFVYGDIEAKSRMNLLTGEISGHNSATPLKPGKKSHQLIATLLNDFYRPMSLGAIFSSLFPDEYFNPFSSPDRVHQVIRRTRSWLKANHIPIEIQESDGRYKLVVHEGFAFDVPLSKVKIDTRTALWQKTIQNFHEPFKASDACDVLSLSATSFRRFADWAIESGRLEKMGSSSATLYRVRAS